MHTTSIRKRIISDPVHAKQSPEPAWLDLAALTEVEITSEDPGYPIDALYCSVGNQVIQYINIFLDPWSHDFSHHVLDTKPANPIRLG